jgi:hypothetical protein
MSRRHLKAWLTWSSESSYFGWYDVTLEPRTPESQFCVVRRQDEKSQSMLERVGSELISAPMNQRINVSEADGRLGSSGSGA